MKCPHCGIEVRDTTVICGYCGGKIPQKKGTPAPAKSGRADTGGIKTQKAATAKKYGGEEPETGEEEEGGLSVLLQPGEQVLIGSLNVSVKKFFFHAYLTDRRVFLIDTQEKKLKVTAKDIPLETIEGSIVEVSENSDPVLVLSIRSADDEIKTMKMVFAQNGMDRSDEIDEWIDLLHEQTRPKKQKKPSVPKAPEPEPEEEEEEPLPALVTKPAPVRQELRPAKKPVKGHERQPPVKRLLSVYQATKQEEPEPRGAEIGPPEEPVQKTPAKPVVYREIPPIREPEVPPVKKAEVQSAMKSAIKGALKPTRQPPAQPAKRPVREPEKKVIPEPEPPVRPEPFGEPSEKEHEDQEEEAGAPLFCQNCGKKLPAAANFCPGCGTKLTHHKPSHAPAAAHEKRSPKPEDKHDDDKTGHRPSKPPAKRAPKGSEMTLLHKFLRR